MLELPVESELRFRVRPPPVSYPRHTCSPPHYRASPAQPRRSIAVHPQLRYGSAAIRSVCFMLLNQRSSPAWMRACLTCTAV